MIRNHLIGKTLIVCANDVFPQDLVAEIIDLRELDSKILLKFNVAVVGSCDTYSFAVASPRLAVDDLESLLDTGRLGCAVTWIPTSKHDPDNAFDLTRWRGGDAAVTDLVLE